MVAELLRRTAGGLIKRQGNKPARFSCDCSCSETQADVTHAVALSGLSYCCMDATVRAQFMCCMESDFGGFKITRLPASVPTKYSSFFVTDCWEEDIASVYGDQNRWENTDCSGDLVLPRELSHCNNACTIYVELRCSPQPSITSGKWRLRAWIKRWSVESDLIFEDTDVAQDVCDNPVTFTNELVAGDCEATRTYNGTCQNSGSFLHHVAAYGGTAVVTPTVSP